MAVAGFGQLNKPAGRRRRWLRWLRRPEWTPHRLRSFSFAVRFVVVGRSPLRSPFGHHRRFTPSIAAFASAAGLRSAAAAPHRVCEYELRGFVTATAWFAPKYILSRQGNEPKAL